MRILIIEDDRDAASYLVKAFREAGHAVDHAADGVTGYDLAHDGGYDVAIVDRMLPKMDGLSLITALRAQGDGTPALILSALGQVDDRVKGLRAGGDDYLAKPYAFSELLARVEALARRKPKGSPEETVYRVGDLVLDRLSHKVTRAGEEIHLTPKEYAMIAELAKHPGRVITHAQLLRAVWGPGHEHDVEYLRVAARGIRRKLEVDPATPQLLRNEPGVGYRLVG